MNVLRTGTMSFILAASKKGGEVQQEPGKSGCDEPKRADSAPDEESSAPRSLLRDRAVGLWSADAAVVVRFALAIVLVELSGTMLNGGVYPRLASYFGIGRELSTLINGTATTDRKSVV